MFNSWKNFARWAETSPDAVSIIGALIFIAAYMVGVNIRNWIYS